MSKQQIHKVEVIEERKRHPNGMYFTEYRVKCQSCAHDIKSYSKLHAMKLRDTHRRSPHRAWLS